MKKLLVFLLSLAPCFAGAQIITTFAGNFGHAFGGDGGQATDAAFDFPCNVKADFAGNILIADFWNARIRSVDTATNIIRTIAGNGHFVHTGDGGAATAAGINSPTALVADRHGNIFVASDSITNAGSVYYTVQGAIIRKINATGVITYLGGNGTSTNTGDDGPATDAGIAPVYGLCVDTVGNLYIATNGFTIRKIDTSGVITTIAGTGVYGHTGDGGPATDAQIICNDLVVDKMGNLIFTACSYVRKISPGGIISTIAGTGSFYCSGDGGPATAAGFGNAWALAIDDSGSLYISDQPTSVVRKIAPNGIIDRIAGTGTSGYSGDGGPADSAQLDDIYGIGIDAQHNIYLADPGNENIRKISAASGTAVAMLPRRTPLGLSARPLAELGSFAIMLAADPGEKAMLLVNSLNGKTIFETTCEPQTEKILKLNVPPGIYLLTAVTSSQRATVRLEVY